VATLLRGEPSCARDIAQVWCLLCDGVESPLHRGDVAELREELGRIRYLLSAGTARPDGRVALPVIKALPQRCTRQYGIKLLGAGPPVTRVAATLPGSLGPANERFRNLLVSW
jgi:hypothetical protein